MYKKFTKALENLHKIQSVEVHPGDVVYIAGMVSLFITCYELSWRAMKEYLTEEGWSEAVSGSPRQIIKTAF